MVRTIERDEAPKEPRVPRLLPTPCPPLAIYVSQGTASTANALKVDRPKFTAKEIQFKDSIEEYQELASKFGFLTCLGPAGSISAHRSIDDEEYSSYVATAIATLDLPRTPCILFEAHARSR